MIIGNNVANKPCGMQFHGMLFPPTYTNTLIYSIRNIIRRTYNGIKIITSDIVEIKNPFIPFHLS